MTHKLASTMMKFYDFLYYLIYRFYALKEKGSASSSAAIIGGLQAMNVLAVLIAILASFQLKDYLNKATFIIVFIFFQITTYIRYIYRENNSVAVIEKRWASLADSERRRYRVLNFIYIFLSISLFFGLAIFFSGKY